ncbi:hypothetical protein C5167_042872, partial [Papaver somniferum]
MLFTTVVSLRFTSLPNHSDLRVDSPSMLWRGELKLLCLQDITNTYLEVLNQRSQEVEIVFHNTSCKKSEQRRLSFILEPVFVDDLQ